MSRRGLTLLLASLLAVGLAASAAVARVPYVALGPGPTYDTLGEVGGTPVISIEGRRTFPTQGMLDLTTVGVVPRLTLFEALQGWFDEDLAVVPREVVYPPDQTDDEVDEVNAQAMTTSQDDATTAALSQIGVPSQVVVAEVTDGAPAQDVLRPGDVITSVDGAPVTTSRALADAVSSREPGEPVRIGYTRAGTAATARLTTASAPGVDGAPPRAVIGVAPEDRFGVTVTIRLKEVGGPSAGLMFALGIIDKLDAVDLTGGAHIAGTGEIGADGTVGAIGGIPQKLLGAREKGATAFLTPAANCAEALATVPDGLRLLRVETLRDALEGLRVLRDGGAPRDCATPVAAAR